ncbi:PPK2 family polyphosphate kinase [Longitalea luteola]|uniref:PPK2 family polyphosphate kinase n=1 Tax=Longitalea luteola TaxID=2812563 RepID=UPI001A963F0C|nr:PPK2 family polyphosphate kinase [Longitalea luteola]
MATIKLKDISTRAPKDWNKEETKIKTIAILQELDELQNLLFAESKHAVLVVLQGMDASGKDSAIRKVFGTLNPQGVRVQSFKVPTELELSHDFLWRIHAAAPPKGVIQIFNRSHYEDVLVTRVHRWIDEKTVKRRMKAINEFEQLLQEHNSTTILKFYLHVSPEEQQERLQERIHNPSKQWKYNEKDFEEARLWDRYMDAYEDCFAHCNDVPWTVVPADQNWYKEYVIADTLKKALEKLDMQYPGLKKE